jgi:predicted ABC-class ATPase
VTNLSSENWLGRLGFRDNPFFQDPVPPDQSAMKAAFIDREDEKKKIVRFVDIPKGRLLILGRTGEGKSSLLNVAQQLC